jgi:hypothetical protein
VSRLSCIEGYGLLWMISFVDIAANEVKGHLQSNGAPLKRERENAR